MPARKSTSPKPEKNKSLESWIWDAACSIRGAKDAPKYKDFILPLIFTKRLCDVFDDTAPRDSASFPTGGKLQSVSKGQDNLNRIAAEVGSRKKAFQLAKRDHKLVRFFLPLEPADPVQPVWSVNRVNSLSHLGKTALIGKIADEMVFESNMMRFSVDESKVRKEYVFKFLNSPLTKKQIVGTAKRAVAQSSINQGDVKSIMVPKPSLEEQDEIATMLEAVEFKIVNAFNKSAILQDLFRTLLHELMTAKTRVHGLELTA